MLCLSSLRSRVNCHSKIVICVTKKMLDWKVVLPESSAVAYSASTVCMPRSEMVTASSRGNTFICVMLPMQCESIVIVSTVLQEAE